MAWVMAVWRLGGRVDEIAEAHDLTHLSRTAGALPEFRPYVAASPTSGTRHEAASRSGLPRRLVAGLQDARPLGHDKHGVQVVAKGVLPDQADVQLAGPQRCDLHGRGHVRCPGAQWSCRAPGGAARAAARSR